MGALGEGMKIPAVQDVISLLSLPVSPAGWEGMKGRRAGGGAGRGRRRS